MHHFFDLRQEQFLAVQQIHRNKQTQAKILQRNEKCIGTAGYICHHAFLVQQTVQLGTVFIRQSQQHILHTGEAVGQLLPQLWIILNEGIEPVGQILL